MSSSVAFINCTQCELFCRPGVGKALYSLSSDAALESVCNILLGRGLPMRLSGGVNDENLDLGVLNGSDSSIGSIGLSASGSQAGVCG